MAFGRVVLARAVIRLQPMMATRPACGRARRSVGVVPAGMSFELLAIGCIGRMVAGGVA